MHKTRRAAERDLIDRVRQFANLRLPQDRTQADELLRPVCVSVGDIALAQLVNDHTDLNKWLAKITSRPILRSRRRFVWRLATLAEVLQLAEGCVVEMRPRYEKSSTLHESFAIKAASVEAAYGYAIGLLIDQGKPWARLVRRCEWRACKKFFLSKAIQGGGSGERMCSDACRNEAQKLSVKLSRSRSG